MRSLRNKDMDKNIKLKLKPIGYSWTAILKPAENMQAVEVSDIHFCTKDKCTCERGVEVK